MESESGAPQRRILSVVRGRVSALNYDYSGSWDIPVDWLELSGLLPYQKIALMNPAPKNARGERTVYTYVLPALRGSGKMNANGGIAHYFEAGGDVIIQSFGTYSDPAQAAQQSPIFLDARGAEPERIGPAAIPPRPDIQDFVAGKLHFASVDVVIDGIQIEGDAVRAQAILTGLANMPALHVMGQPICVLSEDLAAMAGFHSFEAVSLYPANGSPRFNRSIMCWVVPGLQNTFALIGEGLSPIVKPKDRMIACRYTSLKPDQIYAHTASVHILDENNQSQRKVEYRMADYLTPELGWKV